MQKGFYIRKIAVYAVLILLLPSIQVSFPEYLSFHGQIADLMLVFVALSSYMFGFRDGAVLAFFTGLLRDYYASPIIMGVDGTITKTVGLGILVLFLTGAVASSFFTRRLHRKWSFAFVAVLFCTFIYKLVGHLVIYSWLSVIGQNYSIDYSMAIVDSILPQLMLNLIAAVPLYLVLRFIGPYSKGINPSLEDEREVTLLG